MLLIGSRHRRGSSSEAYRFARSGASQPTRRSTLTVPDSSHGVHRSPLRRHDCRCVHTRLDRRPDFGPGLPHPEHVPFLPFLPASTVSSAEGESEDPPLRLPAGLLHPAAGHGVHHVSDSLVRPLDRTRPGGRGPEGPGESSPVANTLRSVPLLDSLRPCRHRASSFRTRSRSPAGVPSRRFEPCSLPCRHAALLCSPTSGLSSVEESVAVARRCRCAPARCSLGLWIDSFPMLPRVSRRPVWCWTFRLAAQPLRRPRPECRGKARCLGLVWLRATDRAAFPEGRTVEDRGGSGTSRRRHLGRIPTGPRRNRWDAGGSARRKVHRVGPGARRYLVANVIATHLRRDSCATQHSLRRAAPVVRAPSPHPSAVARVLDGKTARRGRPHPEVCAPARHSRASRRMLRRNPAAGIPKDSDRWASRGPPGGGSLGDSWLRLTPASWRAGLGPDSHRRHRDGRSRSRRTGTLSLPKIGESAPERRGCGWWPHIPREVVIRRGHRSARAEMDRSPSRASPTGVGSASVPSAPKRFGNPDRCNPGGR